MWSNLGGKGIILGLSLLCHLGGMCLRGSNVAPSTATPCRWHRASRTSPAPSSQQGMKGGFSLHDVHNPPGTPQAVSQWAELRGDAGQRVLGPATRLPHLWWYGPPRFHQPRWGCCSRRPPAPLAEHLLGGPTSPQDGQNPPRFFPGGKICSLFLPATGAAC